MVGYHPLNPQVGIMAVPRGNLQLDELKDVIEMVLSDGTTRSDEIVWRCLSGSLAYKDCSFGMRKNIFPVRLLIR